jgi:hypothetical protein
VQQKEGSDENELKSELDLQLQTRLFTMTKFEYRPKKWVEKESESMKKVNAIFAGCLFALAGALGSCGSVSPTPTPARSLAEFNDPFLLEVAEIRNINPDTFVGKVQGTNAFIAVTSLRGQVLAYVCDGTADGVTISKWFKGTLKDGQLNAKAVDGSPLTGTLNNANALNGTVSLAGASRSFTSAEAASPAGLFLSTTGTSAFINAFENNLPFDDLLLDLGELGWIVLPDGSQHGALNKITGAVGLAPVNTSNGSNTSGERAFNLEMAGKQNLSSRTLSNSCKSIVKLVKLALQGPYWNPGINANLNQGTYETSIRPAAIKGIVKWYADGCYSENGHITDFLT